MMRPATLLAPLLVALCSAGPASAAWPTNPQASVAVCTFISQQLQPVLANDGAGGAYVAWMDHRAGNLDVYMARVINGALAPGWTSTGLPVCVASGDQTQIVLVPGSVGDVYAVWVDNRAGNDDVFVQRVLANGTIAPGWPLNGLALTSSLANQNQMRACSDGAGGVYVVWTLEFTPGTDYDIYASHILAGGTLASGFAVDGLVINGGVLVQDHPDITGDGAGNAIITYESIDGSSVGSIWAQKLGATGARSWGSVATGIQISNIANDQRNVRVVSDDAGGAVLEWDVTVGSDHAEQFAYVNPDGTTRLMVSAVYYSGATTSLQFQSDNHGGGWTLIQPVSGARYVYHVDAIGSAAATPILIQGTFGASYNGLAPLPDGSLITAVSQSGTGGPVGGQHYDSAQNALWNGGSPVIYNTYVGGNQYETALGFGSAGAFVAWSAFHVINYQVQLTRVDQFGALGDASPSITRMSDVPNDQGGFVSVLWNASYKDASPDFAVARYSIWRRVPGATQSGAAPERANVLAASEARPPAAAHVYRAEHTSAGVGYWEYLSQTPARGYPGYSAVVPTTSDSITGSNPLTYVRVEAETAAGVPFWDSAADSGYSVDNLPPLPPAPFTAAYGSGATHLHWGANLEPDLAGYRLYRGASSGFVPGPLNLVVAQSDTGYADAGAAGSYYQLSAVDVHGNESKFALVSPTGTTDVGQGGVLALALEAPRPNPSTGDRLEIQFVLPASGPARIDLLDVGGRCVASRDVSAMGPGRHSVDLAAGRPLAPGMYLARLVASCGARVTRAIVMR